MKWNELDEAVDQGLIAFKLYIEQQKELTDHFLEQFYWHNGKQLSVLNYLIYRYIEPNTQVEPFAILDYVLELTKNSQLSMPLHQAIWEDKTQLALHWLAKATKTDKELVSGFDSNQRDQEGRSLLSLALTKRNTPVLSALLQAQANVHCPTAIDATKTFFQPIHQAVLLDYAEGVRLLAHYGANLSNPCGVEQDTPLLLAARLGNIDALAALLEGPVAQLNLEAERHSQSMRHTAAESLCHLVQQRKNTDLALQGIALLLCHGAKPPRSQTLRRVLSNHRALLLQKIHECLSTKPQLIDSFIMSSHQRESALHNIIYAPHSWETGLRYLWGMPGNAALMIEHLLVKKYAELNEEVAEPLTAAVANSSVQESNPLKLYALFVKRYTDTYQNQFFSNPWSIMRWMIANGQCDWDTVQAYVQTNPDSRSAIVYHDMMKAMTALSTIQLTENSLELSAIDTDLADHKVQSTCI